VFQPELAISLKRGMDQVTHSVLPTAGPVHGNVAVDRPYNTAPEWLDNGGVIARRITSLPDRTEDAGAMLLRGVLWQIQERVGDGTATAAAVFDAIVSGGLRYVAAGGNPVPLRTAIESAIPVIECQIDRLVRPCSPHALERYAMATLSDDPALASAVAEAVDLAGPYGVIELRKGLRNGIGREFVEGSSWPAAELLARPERLPPSGAIQLEQSAILLADLPVATAQDAAALLRLAAACSGSLVAFVDRVSDPARSYLAAGRRDLPGFHLVRLPGGPGTDERVRCLADLAAITGATPLLGIAGHTLSRVPPTSFGSCRRAWLNDGATGIVGGGGDPESVRSLIRQCRQALEPDAPVDRWKSSRARIGRLQGGIVTLSIGALSEIAAKHRMARSEQTIATLRAAVEDGFVPGGGSALLVARGAVRAHFAGSDDEAHRAAETMLETALAAPAHAIRRNAGCHNADIDALDGAHAVFDVRCGRYVDPWEAGILDIASTLRFVVHSAIGAAAQALTVGALVRRRNPPQVEAKG
jgi:chaperonin GroEL